MGRWLTPSAGAASPVVYRMLAAPAVWLPYIAGALWPLAEPYNWEPFGATTPDEAAATMATLIEAWYSGGTTMLGAITPYIGPLPDGVLALDGSTHQRADWPLLYDVLPVAYQTSETEFTLPDARGYYLAGADPSNPAGAVYGANAITLTVDQLPPHTHSTHVHGPDIDVEGPAGVPTPATGIATPSASGSTGAGAAVDNRPATLAVVWGIHAR